MGLEDFPEEFSFTVTNVRGTQKLEGELEPTEIALIEIEFRAIK